MAPAIHIGPGEPEHLISAVEEGGGRSVALEEAEGVVWAGPESDFQLRDSLVGGGRKVGEKLIGFQEGGIGS